MGSRFRPARCFAAWTLAVLAGVVSAGAAAGAESAAAATGAAAEEEAAAAASSRTGASEAGGARGTAGANGANAASGAPAATRQEGDRTKLVCIGEDGLEQVIEGKGTMARRGYLGVEVTELSPELRAHFGAPENAGVMVAKVVAGSPADKAGLKIGDIITSLDGKPVESSVDLRARIRPLADGAALPIELQRDGKPVAVTATIVQKLRREIDLAPFMMKPADAQRILSFRHEPGAAVEGNAPDGAVMPKMRLQPLVSPREEMLEKKLKALEKRLNELENKLPRH
jgi:membrane-associated protease RseP (regulator of RpoE activity)